MIIKMSNEIAVDLFATMAAVRGTLKVTMPNFHVEQTSYGALINAIATGLASGGKVVTVADTRITDCVNRNTP